MVVKFHSNPVHFAKQNRQATTVVLTLLNDTALAQASQRVC